MQGKTQELVNWVKEGVQTDSYPGWSRILIVPNREQATFIYSTYKKELEDIHHRVYFLEEWQRAHLGGEKVEIALDNADMVLQRLFGTNPLKVISIDKDQEGISTLGDRTRILIKLVSLIKEAGGPKDIASWILANFDMQVTKKFSQRKDIYSRYKPIIDMVYGDSESETSLRHGDETPPSSEPMDNVR
jgi:hypothetical protein